MDSMSQDVVQEAPDEIQHALGGLWGNFLVSIPEPQGKLLTQALSLLLLSDEDSLLPVMVSNLLHAEDTDTAFKKMSMYGLLTNNIINTLEQMGLLVSEMANVDHLEQLCQVLSFLHQLDDYEDLIGLGDLLDSTDIPPVIRFVMAMSRFLGEDNVEEFLYEELLEDVSEVTLKALRAGLMGEDPQEAISELLQVRIKANKEFLKDTLAFQHITANGALGASPETYLNFFRMELNQLIMQQTDKASVQYAKEIAGLFLMSDVNSPRIVEDVMEYLRPFITDFAVYSKAEQLVNTLEL